MRRNLGLRIGLVIVVIAVSVWYLYPPRTSINLGLDLQGGIHLVLGVDVDKALEAQVERAGDTVRGELEKKGIVISKIERRGIADLAIQIASPQSWDSALATVTEVLGAFDRKEADQAAGRIVMTLKPREVTQIRELAVRQGLETIRNLVDHKVDPEAALRSGVPDGDEILYQRRVDKETHQERKVPFVVQKKAYVTGRDVATARVSIDQNTSEPYVSVDFNAAGGRAFSDLTDANVGRRLAIVLDGNIHSAPQIRERIPSGRAQITGGFTSAEATDLAIVLRAGALPAPVQVLEERTVGPSLGADSVRQGIVAILASTALVFVFMMAYYRLSGLIADVALGLNLLLLLATMAGFHATLTLPGIAGIALTIGMAVDTNILIFERIREELRGGKTIRGAIEAGFSRAFKTVIDTHVTVLVSGLILFQFGTGPVKGFAVTLMIGIAASLFTAVFFTRLLFDLLYMGPHKRESLSI